ncbi:mCG1041460, partial [Mus musculus]
KGPDYIHLFCDLCWLQT